MVTSCFDPCQETLKLSLIRFVKNNPFRLAEDRILVEQLRLVMGNYNQAVIPVILLATLLVWSLSNDSNVMWMRLWFLAVVLSGLNLYRHSRPYLVHGVSLDSARRVAWVLVALNAVDGLVWGLLSWVTMDTATQTGVTLVVAVAAGMLGGAMATESPVPLIFVAFAIPHLVALAVKLWLLRDPTYSALSLASVIYLTSLLSQSLNTARATRVTIELRFELADSHAKLREIEQRELLAQERQRLMQDMHDGLGSSLVSALRVVEHGQLDEDEIAQVLKGCIDDLKLAIDSMESVESDLLLLLATLRFRLEPRLEASGINLVWEVQSVPKLEWLDPKNALHILRILQEAFTNIIKHTHSTEITVATTVEGPWVVVTVSDNGSGFAVDEALTRGGKGLSNQLRRAAAIGAEMDWTSSPAGSRLSLRLPVKRTSV